MSAPGDRQIWIADIEQTKHPIVIETEPDGPTGLADPAVVAMLGDPEQKTHVELVSDARLESHRRAAEAIADIVHIVIVGRPGDEVTVDTARLQALDQTNPRDRGDLVSADTPPSATVATLPVAEGKLAILVGHPRDQSLRDFYIASTRIYETQRRAKREELRQRRREAEWSTQASGATESLSGSALANNDARGRH